LFINMVKLCRYLILFSLCQFLKVLNRLISYFIGKTNADVKISKTKSAACIEAKKGDQKNLVNRYKLYNL
jgi:hypothetical protein